jgi:NAD(P)-dependent dehydrogenase (short-subunit alcohol dehydrogenase family)
MRPASERAYRRACACPGAIITGMSTRLQGRTAIVVGAGQTPGLTIGNGRATAIAFAREGAEVLLVDRDEDAVRDTHDAIASEGYRSNVLVCDISGDDAPGALVAAARDAFGRIDILHNNVGVGAGDSTPHRLADEDYDRIMDLNLRAMWRTCKAVVPVMREQGGGGVITNISSIAAIAGAGALTAYKLSKAGVNALTQNLALTNAKHGIRVNAIMPGFIDTPLAVDAPAAASGTPRDEVAARRAAAVPLGRQGTAWDVANAAVFLASDEAAFITGVILPVDGGQSARIG